MMRKTFLLALAGLGLAVGSGCAHESWTYQAVPNIMISQTDNLSSQGPMLFKTEPNEMITAKQVAAGALEAGGAKASAKTILIATWKHDLGTYRSSVGRTLVVTLDGPPVLGQFWLSPDNAVLVTYSAYSAPTRERVHLTGSIKIEKISGSEITAQVAVRDVEDVDASGFINHPYDAEYRQWPFKITGERTFTVTTPKDPMIDKSAVKWGNE